MDGLVMSEKLLKRVVGINFIRRSHIFFMKMLLNKHCFSDFLPILLLYDIILVLNYLIV